MQSVMVLYNNKHISNMFVEPFFLFNDKHSNKTSSTIFNEYLLKFRKSSVICRMN